VKNKKNSAWPGVGLVYWSSNRTKLQASITQMVILYLYKLSTLIQHGHIMYK